MSAQKGIETGTVQRAKASGHAHVTQVAGDYEEHHHQYVRGWDYLGSTRVDSHELDRLKHTFVDAPGASGQGQVAEAVRLLRRPDRRCNVLTLVGDAGSGRRTAALRVLREVGVAKERIRWLMLDWDRPRIDQIPHTKGHGFVLDLTGYRSLAEDFYTGLADYQREAAAAEAVLIILAVPETWAPGPLSTVPSVRLSRPAAKDVAEAHLRHLAPERLDWLVKAPLGNLLTESAHPSDAARLATLVTEAQGDAPESIEEEFTEWKAHLRDWFERHCGPEDLRERALLIATALLEGVPADIVMRAADQLFVKVKGVLPPGGALAGQDLDGRLNAIGACQVGEGISLDAKRHGLAEAVLKHVWQQRPPLRQALLEWASDISAPQGVAVQHLQRIAGSLARMSLLPGGTTVQSVASGWIETGRTAHRRLAVEILEAMALHPVTGVGVRKQLYDWAHQKNTSEALATAVAEICSGRLGETYPRVAMTRLRLLATRPDGRGREAAADAVRILAGAAEKRVLVLSEIVAWSESPDGIMRQAGAGTFLALTDITSDQLFPLPASEETSGTSTNTPAEHLFTRGWRAALLEPATADAAHDRLSAWLDSPKLSDDQVLPLAAAVLRGRLGRPRAAELLVGSSASTGLGQDRRRALLDQLLSEQATPATGLEQHIELVTQDASSAS
ncbi:hypothetical protein [Streptomyces sp. NBC_00690]|uniref:hypothetical protein n=1 Tax=Streptomyces sp. NBC_00690 TaxID=2975808 RepID=UPI002E296BE2|nr:hypothetical protein [Streptomyces sp. NBC_00690]